MTQKKKDLPPMPEHDGTDNCPACKEAERVIKEMEASPMLQRFVKLAHHVRDEIEAIEKEYGVRGTVVFGATVENEQTDRIGTSPKEFVIKSKDREMAMEMAGELNRVILEPMLKDLIGPLAEAINKKQQSHNMPIFMGKPGQA